jgi:nitroreductase
VDFENLVRERRSIRKFLDKPVEKSVLNAILEDARLAPSWKNSQGWRLLVLTDREKIMQAGAVLGRNPGCDYSALPVLMLLFMEEGCSGKMDGKDYALVDAGIFIDHLTLAAACHGLGSCVLGWLKHDALKAALNLPEHLNLVAVLPMGYPAESPEPRGRRPLAETVCFNEWSL